MTRLLNIGLIALASLATFGLLAEQATRRKSDAMQEGRFAEQVNLAMRQAAHRLLALAGDRNSMIPPVQHTGPNTWLLRLSRNFDYDSVPPVLAAAFAQHRVTGEYNVAVLDCRNEALILGYTASQLTAGNEIPCGGREQNEGCYDLRVTFTDRMEPAPAGNGMWIAIGAIWAVLLVYLAVKGFEFLNKKKNAGTPLPAASPGSEPAALQFGRSVLLVENQKLLCNGVEKDLTYRETKLLQLFCRHPNQLLERDHILKTVWEDEGILVGRSVDVFVSRLRKLLQGDTSIRIANVHGVGYRLEVRD